MVQRLRRAVAPSGEVTFADAADLALDVLDLRLPWDCWALTRVEGDRQTFSHVRRRAGTIEIGQTQSWRSSLCWETTHGRAPAIAPDTSRIPAFAGKPVQHSGRIGAHVGRSLTSSDGQLVGTLCGVHASPVPEDVVSAQPLVDVLCDLLDAAHRREAGSGSGSGGLPTLTDPATGLLSPRGWDIVMADEDRRLEGTRNPAVIVRIDVLPHRPDTDRAARFPDELDGRVRSAAAALQHAADGTAAAARLGGSQLAVLVATGLEQAAGHVEQMHSALRQAGVSAAMGWAPRTRAGGLTDALKQAETALSEGRSVDGD